MGLFKAAEDRKRVYEIPGKDGPTIVCSIREVDRILKELVAAARGLQGKLPHVNTAANVQLWMELDIVLDARLFFMNKE